MTDAVAPALRAHRSRVVSSFETWPPIVFYAPMFISWLYLAVRYRGLTLPTVANVPPALSGFLGESKSDALALLGPKGSIHIPSYAVIATCTNGDRSENEERAADAMRAAGLNFPLVAKPDVGQNGAGVQIVRDETALSAYLAVFPRGGKLILQKYVVEEGEAGVVYVRHPHEAKGRIASLTLKYLPRVTGDGVSTLRELILRDQRARHFANLYFARHKSGIDGILTAGQQVRLVSVGNHCKGAIFKNGAAHITDQLEAAIDSIAGEISGFFFGRFDIRFRTIADLERAEHFTILEVNGADSEMTHIWDAEETLSGAYRTLYHQYRTVFLLGAENRALGARPATLREFLGAWLRNRKLFRSYRCEE